MIAARLAAAVLCVTLAAGPAVAQGRSDSAPGKNKNTSNGSSASKSGNPKATSRASASGLASPATAASETSAPAASANAVVYYGSWLDDASIVKRGDVWVGLATGYWSGDRNRQIDAPVASVAVGLTRRIQAGGSFSFYHFRDADGVSENGIGNVSLYGKVQLLDPYRAPRAIGVAVTPLVELSPGSEDAVGWALPVNIEAHRGSLRVYGSGGYFSRGAVFATIGADLPIGSRLSLSGNFGQSYARVGTHQTSAGAGVSIGLGATRSVYFGAGRTSMPAEVGAGGTSVAGGMSFLLPRPAAQ